MKSPEDLPVYALTIDKVKLVNLIQNYTGHTVATSKDTIETNIHAGHTAYGRDLVTELDDWISGASCLTVIEDVEFVGYREIDSNLTTLLKRLSGLEGNMTSVQTRLSSLEGESTQAPDLRGINATLTSLQTSVSNLQASLTSLQTMMTDLTARVATLEAGSGTPPPPEPVTGVKGKIYTDTNNNNRLDPGEPGSAGIEVITVSLSNHSDVQRLRTDANGDFSFDRDAGGYLLQAIGGGPNSYAYITIPNNTMLTQNLAY